MRFGLVDCTEITIGDDYEQLLRAFFSCFHCQKMILDFLKTLCIVVHEIKVRKPKVESVKLRYEFQIG